MREIKFRAKDTHDHDWFYFTLADLAFAAPDYLEGIDITDTLGQFIGLQDKRGVEIFEGDILRMKNDKRPYFVKWLEGTATFCLSHDEDSLVGFHFEASLSEIIGNIIEHPDLLN
jgi:uncharacterized phage protein (TIGR01671 family)